MSLVVPLPFADPEDAAVRFVQASLTGRWQPAGIDSARALAETGLDWEAVAALAAAEEVEPLLYHILRHQHLLPATLETGFRAAYHRTGMRNHLALAALDEVLAAFKEAGILALVLKGAALAERVYGNIALRPMGDLDLLLRPSDAPRALEALRRLGYALPATEMRPQDTLAYANEVGLRRPGAVTVPVEIHWGLFDNPLYRDRPGWGWLWQTALPLRADTPGARILGPEAQVLHLCAHLALHHAGEGLLWMHDIAEVIHHYREQLDWRGLLDQAEAAALVLPLQQMLPRVAEGWQAPIAAGVLAELGALQPSPAEARVYAGLSTGPRTVAMEIWSDLAGLGRVDERLRYLAAKLFPEPAYMRQRYQVRHAALLPLYYIYRWLLGARSAIALMGRKDEGERRKDEV